MNKIILESLKEIFPKKKFKKNFDTLKIGSFQEWDSLAHLNLLLLLEKRFKIKFSIKEFSFLIDIKSLKKTIKLKK